MYSMSQKIKVIRTIHKVSFNSCTCKQLKDDLSRVPDNAFLIDWDHEEDTDEVILMFKEKETANNGE